MSKQKSAIRVVVERRSHSVYRWSLIDGVTQASIKGESGTETGRGLAMRAGKYRAEELAHLFPTAQNMTARLRETHPVMQIKERMNGLLT